MVNKNETKGKKNVVKGIIIGALSLGVVGAAFAYFTAQADQKNNVFNIVKSDGPIEIVEPKWDPEPGKDMVPGQIINKDPRTVSKVDYDGWVVMRIEVPKIHATLNGENGMFDAVTLLDVDTENFTLLATDSTDKSTVFYYGYNDIVLSKAHGEKIESGKTVQEGEEKVYMNMTTPVFNRIQVQDFTAVEDGFKGSVDVDSQIIQRVDPNTGVDFKGVADAFKTIGHYAGKSTTATQQAQPSLSQQTQPSLSQQTQPSGE